ncbi:NAD(P)/FAD-dependent oxidoreductase [Novosphingobium sp. fls2-241-R2A-195]|uniref:flavin-containing monooxygenase n=1 Tax=Novosphingobium sp. fls2-241-R2A-195 TaxID=3040296 RepID=UPI00255082BF|nr:NAD(P)/FAD-dependent oxidoreductase [Novosphingobium sp. fls2-241-R2A-195]
MTCLKTDVPAPDELDIPALKAKYLAERDKRLRREGGEQYVRPTGDFSDNYAHDPFTPVAERAPLVEDIDVAILGAGFSGILAGYHLRKQGVTNVRNIDHAGGFGGVWYWNRYPGVQCDNDAYCYLPLLEETGYMPSKKFSDGWEIQAYCQKMAEDFELADKALFHTLVEGIVWDESIKRWHVRTNRGDDIRARFVVMAGGVMNMPKLPGIPGIHDFKGKMFHTSRWEHDYSGGSWTAPELEKLPDKRVAIVGTGATSVQAVPYLGKYAKQLYVLQRTPSNIDERPNPPTDPDWAASLQPGWQQERMANFHRGAQQFFLPGEPDQICDIWTEISRNLNLELEADGFPQLDIGQIMARRDVVDYQVMERLRRRVDAIVEDPKTAESLKPWFRFMCKRPLSNNDYYPTFNQPNVKLIDVSATQGVERMTEKGFVADGVEYEVDLMIFASGFEVTSDLKRRWGIATVEGENGLSIYDHWENGPATLHGVTTDKFPGMFYMGYIQGATNSSTTEQFGRQAEHLAFMIGETVRRGADKFCATAEGVAGYVAHCRANEVDMSEFQQGCTPSYFNNEGDKELKWALFKGYLPGWDAWRDMLADWRLSPDLPGVAFEAREPVN